MGMTKTEKFLDSIAKRVAKQFFRSKNASLNELISAQARKNSLNDEMIKRVIEKSNHYVRNEFYRINDVKQGGVLFEPASYEKIKGVAINKKASAIEESNMEKQASAPSPRYVSDYKHSPRVTLNGLNKSASYDRDYQIYSNQREIDPVEKMQKAASLQLKRLESEYQEVKRELNKQLLKSASAADEALSEILTYINRYKYEGEKDIIKMAATIDPEHLETLYKYASDKLPDNMRLKFQSMLKLINTELPVNYILEGSPLVKKYKGSVTASRRAQSLSNRLDDLERNISRVKTIVSDSFFPLGSTEINKQAGVGAAFRAGLGAAKNFGAGAARALGPLWGATKTVGRAGAKGLGTLGSMGWFLGAGFLGNAMNTPIDDVQDAAKKAKEGDPFAGNQVMATYKQRYPKEYKAYVEDNFKKDEKTGLPGWVAKDPYIKAQSNKKLFELGTDAGKKYIQSYNKHTL